jgi:hypothetical protein
MPESTQHLDLVRRLISYVNSNFSECRSLSIISDLPTTIGGERPPKIQGFAPDLFAIDVPATKTIIGEGKTRQDLETDHSRRQIGAFLYFLSRQPRGILIIAVPWQILGATQRMMRSLQSETEFHHSVEIIILDEIGEYRT